jgi:hypothetical protein
MKKPQRRTTGLLALLATFLVVGGVVMVAMLATPKLDPNTKLSPLAQRPVSTPEATTTGMLVVDAAGARLLQDGESRTLSWPEDVKRLGAPISQLEGVDALTGERVYLTSGFAKESSAGIHSPDGRRSAHPAPSKADGTGSIEIRLGSDRRTVVLRVPNGGGVKDVILVGWWDDETIAFTGRTTSTRMVYAATLMGSVAPVAPIPDTADRLSMREGMLWYVTAEPGEGLESPFVPPSELHRVSRSGLDERLVRSEAQVVMTYTLRGKHIAYELQDESMMLHTDSALPEAPLGTGIPLMFRDAAHLVIQRNGDVISKDVVTGREEMLFHVSESGTMIFSLPESSTMK